MLVEDYFSHPERFSVGTARQSGTAYISTEEVEVWLGHSLPPSVAHRSYKATNHMVKGQRALLNHLNAQEVEAMLSAIRIDGQSMSDMETPEQTASFYEVAMKQIGDFIEASIQSGLEPDDIAEEFKTIFS